MSEPATTRVLIADDHLATRIGLSSLIDRQDGFEVVLAAENGREAVAGCLEHSPNLMLIDLFMPQMSGIDAIREIRLHQAEMPIIVLTTYDDEMDISEAMKAGANGYLLKGFCKDDLFDAMSQVMGGNQYLSPEIKDKLRRHAERPPLTDREQETLERLALGHSNKEIAEELFVTVDTVKAHLKSIYQKLEARDRVSAITRAIKAGLVRLR